MSLNLIERDPVQVPRVGVPNTYYELQNPIFYLLETFARASKTCDRRMAGAEDLLFHDVTFTIFTGPTISSDEEQRVRRMAS